MNNWKLYKADINVSFPFCIPYIKIGAGTSLAVKRWKYHTFTAKGMGSSPGHGTKILHAAKKKKSRGRVCACAQIQENTVMSKADLKFMVNIYYASFFT